MAEEKVTFDSVLDKLPDEVKATVLTDFDTLRTEHAKLVGDLEDQQEANKKLDNKNREIMDQNFELYKRSGKQEQNPDNPNNQHQNQMTDDERKKQFNEDIKSAW